MHCDCGGNIEIKEFIDNGACGDNECCGDIEIYGVMLECKKCKKVLELRNY